MLLNELIYMLWGVSEGEEREKGAENLSGEIIAKSLTNLRQETDTQVL